MVDGDTQMKSEHFTHYPPKDGGNGKLRRWLKWANQELGRIQAENKDSITNEEMVLLYAVLVVSKSLKSGKSLRNS